jgi:DNA-binding FadR family transcriptional regulator
MYLANQAKLGVVALPSIRDLGDQLEMSVTSVREELQVARAMGLVEVKPRTGIKILPFSFKPSVLKSLAFSVNVDKRNFRQFSDMRNHIEASYWYQAVSKLLDEDIKELNQIISKAKEKLNFDPIQLPHDEHRKLHLTIYKRLDNVFVLGILEAYWDMYEAVGLSVYEDRNYLARVWNYHQQMVESINQNNFLSGYQSLIAHMDLLFQREQSNKNIHFE